LAIDSTSFKGGKPRACFAREKEEKGREAADKKRREQDP